MAAGEKAPYPDRDYYYQCEVLHTWMSAYIVVTSSPYFTVTDKKGEFIIERVPAGTHKIEVWHEKLGTQSKTVTVVSGATLRTDFVYRLDKRGSYLRNHNYF